MPHPSTPAAPINPGTAPGGKAVRRPGQWLTAGTPHIAMLTALGGLLVVLAFAIGGWGITETSSQLLGGGFAWTQPGSWAAALLTGGNHTLDIVGLAIAGYVAYRIAGRAAVIPGLIGGVAAMSISPGYLGGLAAGVLAGAATWGLQRITVPAALRPAMISAVIPLAATVATTLTLFGLAGPRLAWLQDTLYNWLVHLEFTSPLTLGLVLGLMVCADLGGPISKIAAGYAIAGIDQGQPTTVHLTFMAVVMAAGMVPALGMSLATVARTKLFTPAERHYGKVSWLLGITSIPQGGIPFALADPLRVIPACLAGGAVTGVLTMTFGATMAVPYGGVFAAGQLGQPLLFAVAVAAGAVVTAATAIALKILPRTVPARATESTAIAGILRRVLAAG